MRRPRFWFILPIFTILAGYSALSTFIFLRCFDRFASDSMHRKPGQANFNRFAGRLEIFVRPTL